MILTDHTVIYGGSFNPPHLAHQMACLYFLEALGASEVWLLPAHMHPFGKELAPFEHRLHMCDLLAAPFAGRVVVSKAEQRPGGSGRTYDTLQHLQQTFADRRFALGIGADILGEVSKWYRWADIDAMLPVVVVGRAGYPVTAQSPLQLPAISSTELRARARAGQSLVGWVPLSVARYVEEHQLYRP